MKTARLSNDVLMPQIMKGTSICALKGDVNELYRLLENAMVYAEAT